MSELISYQWNTAVFPDVFYWVHYQGVGALTTQAIQGMEGVCIISINSDGVTVRTNSNPVTVLNEIDRFIKRYSVTLRGETPLLIFANGID